MKHKANNKVGRGITAWTRHWEIFIKYPSVTDRSVGYKILYTVRENKSLPNSTGLSKNIQIMLSHHLLISCHC